MGDSINSSIQLVFELTLEAFEVTGYSKCELETKAVSRLQGLRVLPSFWVKVEHPSCESWDKQMWLFRLLLLGRVCRLHKCHSLQGNTRTKSEIAVENRHLYV